MKRLSFLSGALFAMTAMLNAYADPNITASAALTPASGFDRMTWDITPEVVPTQVNASYY
ncbi:TPA: hypothetical protein QDC22_000393 [Burkholderia stabilis]|nr:hypothetical protein [Burkholderia stabilis]HDR9646587.1 hypothetical protein [Burkholderia stabilis]HDR9659386.1 hypothetical protein [Burkholderia stabilis]HDR9683025.1 hypothetical protein [Burkholderia stabilis]